MADIKEVELDVDSKLKNIERTEQAKVELLRRRLHTVKYCGHLLSLSLWIETPIKTEDGGKDRTARQQN